MTLANAIAAALKVRYAPYRQDWFEIGRNVEIEPTSIAATQSEAMYFADEEADLAVGLLDQLGNAPCRTALAALREGIKSRLYSILVARLP